MDLVCHTFSCIIAALSQEYMVLSYEGNKWVQPEAYRSIFLELHNCLERSGKDKSFFKELPSTPLNLKQCSHFEYDHCTLLEDYISKKKDKKEV